MQLHPARQARVKQLLLTHLPRRYREREVLDEAKAVFPNVIVARDFDQYKIARER
jgi:ribonuclease Z